MHKGRRLQRVARALSPQVACGQPAEFLVNQRREFVEGLFVAAGPLHQQLRYVVCSRQVIENTAQFSEIVHSLTCLYSRATALQKIKTRHDRFPVRFPRV